MKECEISTESTIKFLSRLLLEFIMRKLRRNKFPPGCQISCFDYLCTVYKGLHFNRACCNYARSFSYHQADLALPLPVLLTSIGYSFCTGCNICIGLPFVMTLMSRCKLHCPFLSIHWYLYCSHLPTPCLLVILMHCYYMTLSFFPDLL